MLRKVSLILNTVRYLKPTQVLYQVKYRLVRARTLADYEKGFSRNGIRNLSFSAKPPVYASFLGDNSFTFLNIEHFFGKEIDWNFQEYGKLWNYNLQYLNYLHQPGISLEEKQGFISSLYDWLRDGRLPLEPYPASLRIINIIRLLSVENDLEEQMLARIHAELNFLSNRLEYHLLGNHLLENAFALIMGGGFFSNENWLRTGEKILREQLQEQILSDGGHFELSPMYHQIIFFRLLELIDWYSKFEKKTKSLEQFLVSKAEIMGSWLENISFKNGDIPHFNDSAEGIAYSTGWLKPYTAKLGVQTDRKEPLGVSGFRSISTSSYECKIDFGQVGPAYQPGHAHADALSFILYYRDKPLFVEQGTSTYNIGKIRSRERSTSAHNTIVINGEDQSQVWSGFRVGKRAKVYITEDSFPNFAAHHDGYKCFGVIHSRSFTFDDNDVTIFDEVKGNANLIKEFHLHIAPGISAETANGTVKLFGIADLEFAGMQEISVTHFQMADGYNRYNEGQKIIVRFQDRLTTTINFKG